jgi:molecular chaperone DnaK (HSP70)
VTCWNASGGSSVTATRKLLASAEAAKVALSIGSSTAISTPLCGDLKMTAEQLTAIAAPLMRRLGAPLARVAAETFLTWDSWCASHPH